MNKKLKKIIIVILSCSLLLGNTAFANEVPKKNTIKTVALPKLTHSTSYKYSFENYLKILPFKLNEEDEKRAKNIFQEIDRAFTDGKYAHAEKLIKEFYSIVDDYWMSEKTLKVLLPFNEMITSLGKILTPEQKVKLEKDFDQLSILRKRKDITSYFNQVKKIYANYYEALGGALGDSHNELQLIAYIKGADQLTKNDLINYSFDDYLKILPFNVNNTDYVKGKKVFDNIVEELKVNNNEKAKKLTSKLYKILLPYWFKEDARKNLVPHERYIASSIKYFHRDDQLKLNTILNEIEGARKEQNYKLYFEKINAYYRAFSIGMQNYYSDYFDELALIYS